MKLIPCKIRFKNEYENAMVDDEDYEFLYRFNWFQNEQGYACANGKIKGEHKSNILMHRWIMFCPKGMVVDHIDGNVLNNQKSNLRICTQQQNMMNRKANKNQKTKGITFREGKYIVRIGYQKKRIHIGRFVTLEEAINAYNEKAKEIHGEFAKLMGVE